jgi:hypothetical protein
MVDDVTSPSFEVNRSGRDSLPVNAPVSELIAYLQKKQANVPEDPAITRYNSVDKNARNKESPEAIISTAFSRSEEESPEKFVKLSMKEFETNVRKLGGLGYRLDYDHLASSSLEAIAIKPYYQFFKGDDYIIKWWIYAKKWNLLTGDLLKLDTKLATLPGYPESSVQFWIKFKKYYDKFRKDKQARGNASNRDRDPLAEGGRAPGVSGTEGGKKSRKSLHGRREGDDVQLDERTSTALPRRDEGSKSSNSDDSEDTAAEVFRTLLHTIKDRCRGRTARVICIGDVHGCVEELQDMLRKVQYHPGDVVLLLGDLVAKGPESLAVVQLAREVGAVMVRGNHDYEVIRKATTKSKKSQNILASAQSNNISTSAIRYKATREHDSIAMQLTPEDVVWVKKAPYFVHSPDLGSLFVHAAIKVGLLTCQITSLYPR